MVNVRKEEALHVRYLLIYYFLQGVGLALFFTVANALFLSRFSAEELPVAYISAAVAMLLAGKGYDYIEHKYSMYKRAYLLIIMAVSVLSFYIGASFISALWLPFSFFIWYRVIYNICDLEFWGLSSQIFDTRQAKRLFGLISAGEVPARLIGYFSVALLVPVIGLLNLLLISCVAFFLSFFILRRLLHKHHAGGDPHHSHGHPTHEHDHGKPAETLIRFFHSHFILILGILYVVGAVTLTLADFSFLSEVEEKFHTATDLAKFFSLVFGIGNAIIFVAKLFFSGRVVSRIGVKWSLLSLPLFIVLICLTIAFVGRKEEAEYPLMMFFVVLVIGGDLFKAIFYEPLFLTLTAYLLRLS